MQEMKYEDLENRAIESERLDALRHLEARARVKSVIDLGAHPKRSIPRCECGRPRHPDLSCSYCSSRREFWHRAQKDHPEMLREDAILIGSFVAGMCEAYIHEHGRGRRISKNSFDVAVDMAAAYMKGIGFTFSAGAE